MAPVGLGDGVAQPVGIGRHGDRMDMVGIMPQAPTSTPASLARAASMSR
jgi:hypothetical protein